jgi:hypothetical protein
MEAQWLMLRSGGNTVRPWQMSLLYGGIAGAIPGSIVEMPPGMPFDGREGGLESPRGSDSPGDQSYQGLRFRFDPYAPLAKRRPPLDDPTGGAFELVGWNAIHLRH